MKNLVEYILESGSFTLTDYERDALLDVVGILSGNLGSEEDIKLFSEYWDILSNDEKEQMTDLYDLLDDKHTWPRINRRLLKDDIDLLLNFLNWADEKELIKDNYDLYDVIDKLEK